MWLRASFQTPCGDATIIVTANKLSALRVPRNRTQTLTIIVSQIGTFVAQIPQYNTARFESNQKLQRESERCIFHLLQMCWGCFFLFTPTLFESIGQSLRWTMMPGRVLHDLWIDPGGKRQEKRLIEFKIRNAHHQQHRRVIRIANHEPLGTT